MSRKIKSSVFSVFDFASLSLAVFKVRHNIIEKGSVMSRNDVIFQSANLKKFNLL